MRIFAASLATETNSFSPIPTNRASYEATIYFPPGKHPDGGTLCTGPLWVARRRAKQEGFELIEGSCFWAEPSGPTTQAAYESMRDEILDQLKAAMPVDGVLLGLHGAMMAHGYDDCEGDIIARVREIVGPKAIIGAEQDPHCHLTEKRIRGCNIMILFKEYPHIDFAERADELVTLVVKAIRGEIRPVMSLYDCGMIELFPTSREPGRSFVDQMKKREGRDGVLSISLGHGFPQGDAPEQGTRVLVVTDNAKPKGDALARQLADEIRQKRGTWYPPFLTLDDAITAAYAEEQGPVVVADPSDNAGGGAASDNTNIIRRLLERGVTDAAVGPVWDPIAVQLCHAAGVGAKIPLRFGGKTAVTSGEPIDGEVTIIGLAKDGMQSFGNAKVKFGDAAGIRIGGVDVALIAHRTQALGTEIFTASGIDLATKKYVGVKSTNHFHAAYAPIAAKVIYCNGEGPSSMDVRKYPYRKARRTIWPHTELPPGQLIV
ncbi:MAG: M81 family metallopeptidase [Alphaproteobacteria bacterium]|nr:M81 family metallopeptidase [Alphaproteobacteria bacterium]